MKKVFSFLMISFILASCGGNVAKFKPLIEELGGNWDGATSAVTEFSKMVSGEQANLQSLTNGLSIDSAISDKWDEATATQFNNIKAMVETNTSGLSSISTDLDGFMSSWIEKGKDLAALKEGVAAGKLEGDIQGKITALTTAVTEANSKVGGWKEQLGKIKSAISDAKNMFDSFKAANNL